MLRLWKSHPHGRQFPLYAQKDLPNQFEVFKVAAENMQKEVQARTQKAQEKAGEAPEQSVSNNVSQDVKQESKHDKGVI